MASASFQKGNTVRIWTENRGVPSQSQSFWYWCAIETTINLDAFIDDLYELYQFDERQQFIEATVFTKIREDLKEVIDDGYEACMEALLGPDWEGPLGKYSVKMPEE